jgi:tRNA pseudouridine55 synthase
MTAGAGRVAGPKVAWRDVDGILLLDKPHGLSSNAALQRVRRLYRARKGGHTGSLDPLATGLLPVCFGQATKISGLLLDADKGYVATLALGAATATGDAEGEVIERATVPVLDASTVASAMAGFIGTLAQCPPMYSALKHQGQRLYALARRGVEVERQARLVVIHRLELLSLGDGTLEFEVHCGKGTYVRTLGEDLARALGTVGHLAALRRTRLGPFDGQPLLTVAALESRVAEGGETALDAVLLPSDAALSGYPAVTLGDDDARRIRHGQAVGAAVPPGARVRIYGPDQSFLGLGLGGADGCRVAPVRLLTDAARGARTPVSTRFWRLGTAGSLPVAQVVDQVEDWGADE